jgi:hypothetical protein
MGLRTLYLKLTIKDLNEAKQTTGSHKGGSDDDATEKTTM